MSSHSSHHPLEVLLAQFSLYVHKGGLKPDSFHFILRSRRQFGKLAFLFSSASLLLHLVGRSALLFPSDYLLLDLVGRSASRHFSSASLLPHLVGRSAGWHFSSHLPAFFYIWSAGRLFSSHPQEVLLAQFSLYVHKGGLKPDSFHFIFRSGRQVGKPALLISSASLRLHLVGRSAGRHFSSHLIYHYY